MHALAQAQQTTTPPLFEISMGSQNVFDCLNKCGIDEPVDTTSRSIGGSETTAHTHPWIVRIQITIYCGNPQVLVRNDACTGFIIGKHHILSAAHCFFTDLHRTNPACKLNNPYQEDKWMKIKLTDIKVFPTYDNYWPRLRDQSYHYVTDIDTGRFFNAELAASGSAVQSEDYALITVSPEFVFSEGKVRKLCIPLAAPSFTGINPLGTYILAGWGIAFDQFAVNAMGQLSPGNTQNYLRETTSFIQNNDYCSSVYKGLLYNPAKHVCGGRIGHGGTGGDSGAPMQMNWNGRTFAVGLFTNANKKIQSRQIYPDTFIRTDQLCNYLRMKMGEEVCMSFLTAEDKSCTKILTDRRTKLFKPSLNVLANSKVTNETMIQTQLDKEKIYGDSSAPHFHYGNFSFFCFYVPINNEDQLSSIDSFYDQVGCSHIIYGFAEILPNGILKTPQEHDIQMHSNFNNYKMITNLQKMRYGPKVILGIKQNNTQFLHDPGMMRNISTNIVRHVRLWGFSGIFLKFPRDVLMSAGFEQFVENIGAEIALDANKTMGNGKTNKKLTLMLSIPQNIVRYIWRRMPNFNSYFDAYYIWSDETESVEKKPLPEKAIPVDPLHSSLKVSAHESFGHIVEWFAEKHVPREKIIVGLSAWTRSYYISEDDNIPQKMPHVTDFGDSGNETQQEDGKLAFQEFCSIRIRLHPNYDNISETLVFMDGNQWFSLNEPSVAFLHKIQWIKNSKFHGLGLYSIQGDDPKGNCNKGKLPLHKFVGNSYFKSEL